MTEQHTLPISIAFDGDRAAFAKAFVAAQKDMEAVKKASTNPAFKSKYADLAGVVEAVVPALNAHGIGVIQSPGYDGDLVSVTTMLMHESGASMVGVLNLRPSKTDPQGVGSAVTYGRRYSLLAMTGAAPEDDDGNAASGPRQGQSQQRPQQRQQTQGPTLSDRADALEAAIRQASPDDLPKAWEKGAQLLATLSTEDPERLNSITALYEQRLDIPF